MAKEKVINKPYLSVVIPAFNEETNILETLKKTESYLETRDYTYEILVVDDGSIDSTFQIAQNFAKTSKSITVQKLPHRGKAPTVIDGMRMAKGERILFTDADSATPIEEVKKLLHYINDENYDVAIGSREGTGAVRHNEPFIRHFMGRVFNLIVKILLFKGIEDTQCGFKMFTAEANKKIIPKLKIYENAKEIKHASVSAFDVEILYVAKKLDLKIKSVPVDWTYGEDTKVNNIRDSWNNFKDVVTVWNNGRKGKYN
jgi:glycosyltransferase involved in cell wall biosynthesis